MEKVIVLTGPTASGKTKLSLAIAKALNTEIINGDAFQIYKLMNIGTSKPSLTERNGIKHHLMDVLSPLEPFSIRDYQILVREKIAEFETNKKIPLIVGGSGLYIDSVIYDYRFESESRSSEFESKYQDLSNFEVHQILEKLDPEAAKNIHMNNRKRVLRKIELINSNTPNINRELKHQKVYDFLLICLENDRDILYQRINQRVDEMLSEGLLEEVKNLYPDKISTQASKAIGYQELFQYYNQELTLEEAVSLIKQHTRNYAKRQLTWYRNHQDVKYVTIDNQNFDNTIAETLLLINNFLKK